MLKELLKDHRTGMSQFQDDYFVTARAGGTSYGCYKQSLRELYKRLRGLREAFCDQKKLQIEIEQEKHISENEKDEFKVRLANVEYKRKTMQMEEVDRLIKDTKREFLRFFQQASYLKEKLGALTDERIQKLDIEMWEYKIKEMAAIDFVTTGRLSHSTYEFINALPLELRNKLLHLVKNHSNLLNWYENKEDILEFKNFPTVTFNFKDQMIPELDEDSI